eukprot:761879-Hanusia_phi.AAC.3
MLMGADEELGPVAMQSPSPRVFEAVCETAREETEGAGAGVSRQERWVGAWAAGGRTEHGLEGGTMGTGPAVEEGVRAASGGGV